ncbi:hypothetical protein HA402_008895 [Bradysia odoriphaga]|nr:hypothetical protein HA402_008895 [Bradysia odoriphaga]
MVWNIRKVVRYGDVFMILDNKSLRLGGSVLIDKVDFSYDFNARVMGLGATGTVIGTVTDTIVTGEFSINLNDTNVILNDMQIMSFGDIAVQLKSNVVLRWMSEPFLRTITRLFQSRITTTVSDGVRDYTRKLLNDINDNDRLNIKKYFHSIIPILDTKDR